MTDIRANRVVRQPGRASSEHEPGEHVGLEPLDLLRARRHRKLTQIPNDRQPHAPAS
jgi:hypothetical protein